MKRNNNHTAPETYSSDSNVSELSIPKRKRNLELVYRRPFNKLAYQYSLLGVSNIELAKLFNVKPATILSWRMTFPAFDKAIIKGRAAADGAVVEALYNKAVGSTYKETVSKVIDGELQTVEITKRILPDVIAQKHWLSSRRPDEWKEDNTVKVDANINLPMYKPQIHSFDGEEIEQPALADTSERPPIDENELYEPHGLIDESGNNYDEPLTHDDLIDLERDE